MTGVFKSDAKVVPLPVAAKHQPFIFLYGFDLLPIVKPFDVGQFVAV